MWLATVLKLLSYLQLVGNTFLVCNRKNSSLVCQTVQYFQLSKSVVGTYYNYFLFEAIQKDNNFSKMKDKLEHHREKFMPHYCCKCQPLTVIFFKMYFLLFFMQTACQSGQEAEELSN